MVSIRAAGVMRSAPLDSTHQAGEPAAAGLAADRPGSGQEHFLAPDLGPGGVGPGDRHRQQPVAAGLAGAGVEQVMNGPAVVRGPPREPDRGGAEGAAGERYSRQRRSTAPRVLDPQPLGSAVLRRSAEDDVASGIEKGAAAGGQHQRAPRPAQSEPLADAAKIDWNGDDRGRWPEDLGRTP